MSLFWLTQLYLRYRTSIGRNWGIYYYDFITAVLNTHILLMESIIDLFCSVHNTSVHNDISRNYSDLNRFLIRRSAGKWDFFLCGHFQIQNFQAKFEHQLSPRACNCINLFEVNLALVFPASLCMRDKTLLTTIDNILVI